MSIMDLSYAPNLDVVVRSISTLNSTDVFYANAALPFVFTVSGSAINLNCTFRRVGNVVYFTLLSTVNRSGTNQGFIQLFNGFDSNPSLAPFKPTSQQYMPFPQQDNSLTSMGVLEVSPVGAGIMNFGFGINAGHALSPGANGVVNASCFWTVA